MQNSIHIETLLFRKKKGSSHIKKILSAKKTLGIPHNINKFANNMDIIVSGEQSKFLNIFWTSSFLSNHDKTFFFKFHNNTLGYNNVVAHFVRNHSPLCTFCDIIQSPEQNTETPVHLFFECQNVITVLENVFRRITVNENFAFSKREFFVSFERRELSFPSNKALTLLSKLLIKYIWDCRNRRYLPNVENCIENIGIYIQAVTEVNKNFRDIWNNAAIIRLREYEYNQYQHP
jgi:hypothetical protein